MTTYQWLNADHTMIAATNGTHTVVIEPGHRDWIAVSARGDIAEYAPPSADEQLAAGRAGMVCTPAQMRLALDDMEAPDDDTKTMLDVVEGIVARDRKASIVWEYATQIVRTSPLIEALGSDFTPEEIDDIFRAAMAV